MPLYLHVDMDAFFVSVEMRDDPTLKGHPAVVGGGSGNKGIITAANYEARKYGLKAGMTVVEARRKCPKCIFVPMHVEKYIDASRKVFALLDRFSPDVKVLSVDEASVEISGLYRLFGPPEEIGRRIRMAIRENVNLPATVGIASNRLIAKVAADLAKPDGLSYVPPGTEAAFLSPLPVKEMAGIGPATEAALTRLGITTLGRLSHAPLDIMKSHFGVVGEWLVGMAKGEYVGRMELDDQRGEVERSMGHERTFEAPLTNRDDLRAWIVALAEMVGRRLRRAKLGGKVLTLRLRYNDFETLSHQSALIYYTNDEQDMIEEGWRLLDQIWQVGRAVRLVGISLGGLKPWSEVGRQMNLFFVRDPVRREELYKALDTVKNRFGDKAILRAMGLKWRVRRRVISFGHIPQ